MWSVPRGVYKTQSNIYDGAILQKLLPAKSSIVDVRLGFLYASGSHQRKYFYSSGLKTQNCCKPSSGNQALLFFFFFSFIQKHIYNGHINKMKKAKTKIHITVIRCKTTITPDIKLKEEQLQN